MKNKEKTKKTVNDKYPLLFKKDKSNIEKENERFHKAWKQAKKAASILKDNFGASDVYVFGSLTDRTFFHMNSDIDLAETGIPDEKFYAAVGYLLRTIKDFKIDLIDIENCRNSLKECVQKEGVKL